MVGQGSIKILINNVKCDVSEASDRAVCVLSQHVQIFLVHEGEYDPPHPLTSVRLGAGTSHETEECTSVFCSCIFYIIIKIIISVLK